MQLLCFTVHDAAAGAFLQPFFFQARGQASRAFADSVNDPEHMFGKHPHDYTLFALGTFNSIEGTFDSMPPESLGNGLSFVVPEGMSISVEHPDRESVQ